MNQGSNVFGKLPTKFICCLLLILNAFITYSDSEDSEAISPTILSSSISFHLAKPQQSTPFPSAAANKQRLKRMTKRQETMKDVLGKFGLSSSKALSPTKRLMIDLIMKGKRALAAEKMRSAKFKEKWKMASSKEALWEKLAEETSRNLSDFCKRQAKLQRVKPNGRRFSLEDKMLALQLRKKGCIAMKDLATLPSPKTMDRTRHRMPMKCGFSPILLRAIAKFVKSLKNKLDSSVILMWDEMSIDKFLTWSSKYNQFFGFEDYGHLGRTKNVADHALIFMIRGI
jgi:hypothetical protein